MSVVAQGGSANDAVAIVREHKPDVLLLDISLPGNGIEAARRIAAEQAGTRVIMLSSSDEDLEVARAIEAGASGYVVKGVNRSELYDAIKAVDAGEAYISARLATRYAMRHLRNSRGEEPCSAPSEMSSRESEIFKLARDGLSNREIARQLGLSISTVKNNMSRVLRKMNSRNRIEAMQRFAP